jgi:hypothetical protein
MAKWTNETSETCSQATSADSASAISSPASADGPTRSDSPAGPTITTAGPGPVRVSRFRALDNDKAMSIDAISGPLFIGSSPSAVLQWSLESRLRARTDVNGSPEYVLMWKHWDMPAGVPICALRGRAHLISGNGCIGWPTPTATDAKLRAYQYDGGDKSKPRASLTGTLRLCGYPTPRSSDRGPRNPETARKKLTTDGRTMHHRIEDLLTALGTATGYPNPAFLFWLMGFPESWIRFAPVAMPLSRKSRKRSSKPISTVKGPSGGS